MPAMRRCTLTAAQDLGAQSLPPLCAHAGPDIYSCACSLQRTAIMTSSMNNALSSGIQTPKP